MITVFMDPKAHTKQQLQNMVAQNAGQTSSMPQPAPHQPVDISGKPFVPTGGMGKEHLPMAGRAVEYVAPTDVEPDLPAEVKDIGMEVSEDSHTPKLTQEHLAVGIEPAKESVPVQIAPTPGKVQLAWDDTQIKKLKKSNNWHNSLRWLVELFAKEEKRGKSVVQ